MKNRKGFLIAILCAHSFVLAAQDKDSTGLPGENFSLEGALELFKKSSSPEEFEKLLNEENSKVNNLDLNGDGETDYIKVIDKQEDNVHAFVLQAAVSENESQDVAVIEVEKNSDDDATVQIVGDEDLYGEETIVEPTQQVKSNAGTTTNNAVVNVWTWPTVRYVYAPAYRVWVSPWGWRARPLWWKPWRPVRYAVYYGYHAPYRPRYVVVHTHRTVHAHRIYRPARTTSVIVRTRHQAPVTHYRSNTTRTRATTTVTSPNRSRSNTTTSPSRQRKVTRTTTTTTNNKERVKRTKATKTSKRATRARE